MVKKIQSFSKKHKLFAEKTFAYLSAQATKNSETLASGRTKTDLIV